MLTKQKTKEILEETFGFEVLDEDVQKVFEKFVVLLNDKAVEQSRVVGKCPSCDGKGWFGEQFCNGEECPTCEGTGICH